MIEPKSVATTPSVERRAMGGMPGGDRVVVSVEAVPIFVPTINQYVETQLLAIVS